MDAELKENKQTIRNFMGKYYTDERLAMLLAHARDGKLAYISCCCFIGIPTADHALQGVNTNLGKAVHYKVAGALPGADNAENAYCFLGAGDSQRVRRLIPIIKAEMKRRERERALAGDGLALLLSGDLVPGGVN